jgi:hypothetical protein
MEENCIGSRSPQRTVALEKKKILPLDSITESKRKCKSDNEAKKSCKVMTLDEKINILDKLRGGMSAAAVGLTFR